MEIIRESDNPINGGVRYMKRGPIIDWGIISLEPQQEKSPHYHEHLAETFYVVKGTITFILKEKNVDIPEGTAIRLLNHESHGLKNNSNEKEAKLIFIKEQYLPEDDLLFLQRALNHRLNNGGRSSERKQ